MANQDVRTQECAGKLNKAIQNDRGQCGIIEASSVMHTFLSFVEALDLKQSHAKTAKIVPSAEISCSAAIVYSAEIISMLYSPSCKSHPGWIELHCFLLASVIV